MVCLFFWVCHFQLNHLRYKIYYQNYNNQYDYKCLNQEDFSSVIATHIFLPIEKSHVVLLLSKLFIVIFTSIITIGAIIWALTRTPIYEVKSNIQIGFIGKDLIADPSTLIKTANSPFSFY